MDEEVDETLYHQIAIQKFFESIRRDHISPEEGARMIDEFHLEELYQTKFEEGRCIRQREIAAAMLREGIATEIMIKTTGLSRNEIDLLQEAKN